MDPVPSTQASGQISADGQFRWDGQQWVPLAAGYREPIPVAGLIISELVRGAGPGDVRLDAGRGHQIRPVGHEESRALAA